MFRDRYGLAELRRVGPGGCRALDYRAQADMSNLPVGKSVAARSLHNDLLIDALVRPAFSALTVSPGARAFYDRHRARGLEHQAALRQLANRLVGILHGCLKTRTVYDKTTASSVNRREATAV